MGYITPKCNDCGSHGVILYSVVRYGGGSYRRARRQYSASLCRWCISGLRATAKEMNRSSGDTIYSYVVRYVNSSFDEISAERTLIGDTLFAQKEAEWYWLEYKRLTPTMKERIDSETEEYRSAFNAFTPS